MAQMAEARSTDLLLVAQSNAGLPQLVGDHFEYDAPPAAMAAHAGRLQALGVDLIGACCGSTPDHLRAMTGMLGEA
jgi:5-methyltetrahydrofolate--homocysteine methyltransferase